MLIDVLKVQDKYSCRIKFKEFRCEQGVIIDSNINLKRKEE